MNLAIRLLGRALCRFGKHAFWPWGRDEWVCTRGLHREPDYSFEPVGGRQ